MNSDRLINKFVVLAFVALIVVLLVVFCVVPAFFPFEVNVEPRIVSAQDPYPEPTYKPTPPAGLSIIQICGYDVYYTRVCQEFLSNGSPIQEWTLEIGEISIERR